MRILFVLLVLANLALFAAGQGFFGPAPADRGRDPERLLTELHPETIHVPSDPERHTDSAPPALPDPDKTNVNAPTAPEPAPSAPSPDMPSVETASAEAPDTPAPPPAPAPEATPAPTPEVAPAPAQLVAAPSPAPSTPTAPVETVCREWGSFTEAESQRARQWLRANWAKVSVQATTETGPTSWMVLVPAANSLAAAQKTAARLTQQGIKELFVIQEAGPNQYAISLGVFSQEKSARSLAQSLQGKAGRSLQVIPRPGPSRHWLKFPALEANQQANLRQQALQRFKREWRVCAR